MSNKRLLKELSRLIKEQSHRPLLDNEYLIAFDDTNLNTVYSIIKAPYDSVYRHKFIRLNFDIPSDYPHSPPKVSFVNIDGVRIHPNMYQDGKCCSTILNTWPSSLSENGNKLESWTSSMGIETVLLTFQSFLDNHPYTYEPGGRDDVSYTDFVLYKSWDTCLLKYLQDRDQPKLFLTYMHNYLLINIDSILEDLNNLGTLYPSGYYYTRCFEIDNYIINYKHISCNIEYYYEFINYKDNYECENDNLDYNTFTNTEYTCQICFDTQTDKSLGTFTLSCGHSFHIQCLHEHITNNGRVCSLCRKDITVLQYQTIEDTAQTKDEDEDKAWILNPDTRRRIKVGGKTHRRLLEEGVL